jgi:hypothetical protein
VPFLHGGDAMKPTRMLHELGQSLWLDNITRDLLDRGALAAQLQDEGTKSFVNSWNNLMEVLVAKSADLRKAS